MKFKGLSVVLILMMGLMIVFVSGCVSPNNQTANNTSTTNHSSKVNATSKNNNTNEDGFASILPKDPREAYNGGFDDGVKYQQWEDSNKDPQTTEPTTSTTNETSSSTG